MILYSVLMLVPAAVIGGLECLESRTIRTKNDLARIQGCKSYVGSLNIDATEPLEVTLDLQSHVGVFKIVGDNILKVQLNKIKVITGDLFIKASNVETIQLNALKSQTGKLEIINSKNLKQVSLNSLGSVVGDVIFKNLENVESIELPKFKALCGRFELTGVDKLTTFSIPNMEAYEVMIYIDSKSLSDLNLGKMVEKPGSSFNFKNKATFEMNTKIEKSCKSEIFGYDGTNQFINDAISDSIPNYTQSNYAILLTSVVSILLQCYLII